MERSYSDVRTESLPTVGGETVQSETRQRAGASALNLLFAAALFTDLFLPVLIAQGWIPAEARWLSHAALAAMIVGSVLRIAYFNHVPKAVWLIAGYSVVTVLSAIYQGQGLLPILWGWWLLFQFPFAGLFAYLQPTWPEHFPQKLLRALIILFILEVAIQVVQYVTGTPVGDQLSGTFGRNGTGNLVMASVFALCLAFGRWINSKRWLGLVALIGLGSVSSILGEMKLFLIAIVLLGIISAGMYAARRSFLLHFFGYAALITAAVMGFFYMYNAVVPGAQDNPLQDYINQPQRLFNYLNRYERRVVEGGYYTDMGRNFALAYGWDALQKEPKTLILGWGVGTRGESRTLGTEGVALTSSNLGASSGTSLLVLMQEHGLFGMALLVGFFAWVVAALSKGIRKDPESESNDLRYGLILFTLLWPVWLWYGPVWSARVVMLLYWMALGYTLAQSNGMITRLQGKISRDLNLALEEENG